MQTYANLGGSSSVVAYDIGPGSITVRFRDGATYLYIDNSASPAHIAAMQALAEAGRGLHGYINRHARHGYAARLR